MIQPKELRIGNWFDDVNNKSYMGPTRQQVESIDRYGVNKWQDMGSSGQVEFENMEPIPLTPEILEKCGFFRNEYEKFIFNHMSREISLFEDINNRIRLRCDTHQVLIDHLHQLQNLYFALTGEELNYQP
jgi:hypothetical protein